MKHPAASCGMSGEILRSRYPPSPQPSPRFRWAARSFSEGGKTTEGSPAFIPQQATVYLGKENNMIASADRPAKGRIGQVVANGIVADWMNSAP